MAVVGTLRARQGGTVIYVYAADIDITIELSLPHSAARGRRRVERWPAVDCWARMQLILAGTLFRMNERLAR